MFLQLQFEAFYTANLLNAKWKVVPARNNGWKKIYLYKSQYLDTVLATYTPRRTKLNRFYQLSRGECP